MTILSLSLSLYIYTHTRTHTHARFAEKICIVTHWLTSLQGKSLVSFDSSIVDQECKKQAYQIGKYFISKHSDLFKTVT